LALRDAHPGQARAHPQDEGIRLSRRIGERELVELDAGPMKQCFTLHRIQDDGIFLGFTPNGVAIGVPAGVAEQGKGDGKADKKSCNPSRRNDRDQPSPE